MHANIKKHPALIATDCIKNLCSPLKKLNISYFAHVNINQAGEFAAVSSNPAFSEHYLLNKYYNFDIHLADTKRFGQFILWDEIERRAETETMHTEAAQFGVKHTFTVIKEGKDSQDFYHFATDLDNIDINQIYVGNIDLLECFIAFFNDCSSRNQSLKRYMDFKFSIEKKTAEYKIKDETLPNFTNKNRLHFIEEMNQHGHYVKEVNLSSLNSFAISPREKEFLHWLVFGKTAPEIALILNISKRTAEKHLLSIKDKMGCSTLFELGYKLRELQPL